MKKAYLAPSQSIFRELLSSEREWAIIHWAKYLLSDYPPINGIACPQCNYFTKFLYVSGFKKGKTKPLIQAHSARLFYCWGCDTFYSTSMLEFKECGYMCRS